MADRQLYQLPYIPAPSLAFEIDWRICAAAVRAYNRSMGDHGRDRMTERVFVVAVGNVYVVWDPDNPVGEFIRMLVLDSHFKELSAWVN